MATGMRSITTFFKEAWLVLTLAVVLGGALAIVERSLEAKIQHNVAARLEKAILEVVPQGVSSEATTLAGHDVYRVADADNRLMGWAVPAETMGFQDRIRVLIGLSADGRIIRGLAILKSTETPGLGEKIRDADFRGQFADNPSDATLEVVKTGQSAEHPIHAITGATISSRAVTDAVNAQLAEVRQVIAANAEPSDAEANEP